MIKERITKSKRTWNIGVALGLFAYKWWALASVYFKALSHVTAFEVLAHRVIWSAVLLAAGLMLFRKGAISSIRRGLDKRTILHLVISSLLLFTCWFLFVWAVINGHLLQVSLGYLLNPVACVLLGFAYLKERFQTAHVMGVVLATIAVAVFGIGHSVIPAISLVFAFSFALYGILHSKIALDPITCVLLETIILTPLCLAYLMLAYHRGQMVFGHLNMWTDLLLLSAGIVTTIPLVCFLMAVQRMRFSSLGMMMYVMPTITLIIAVFVFDEPFDTLRLFSFAIAWIGVAIYTIPTIKKAVVTGHLASPQCCANKRGIL